MRRVGAWLDHVAGEDSEATGGLAGGKGRLLTRSKYVHELSLFTLTTNSLSGPQLTFAKCFSKTCLVRLGARWLPDEWSRLREWPLHRRMQPSSLPSRTGHVLLTTASAGQRASLVPPFPGSHAFTELLNWMNRRGAKTGFVPRYSVNAD